MSHLSFCCKSPVPDVSGIHLNENGCGNDQISLRDIDSPQHCTVSFLEPSKILLNYFLTVMMVSTVLILVSR